MRHLTILLVGTLLITAGVAACGSGGGRATQQTTGPTVVNTCARPAPGAILETARGAGIVRSVADLERGDRLVLRVTLARLSDFATSADGNSSNNGGPTFNIDIDCGPRDSNNTTNPPPAAS